MSAPQSWEEKARAKRESLESLIPHAWRMRDQIPSVDEQQDVTSVPRRYLTEREIQITESDAETIVKNTRTGQWKAEEVTRAFCHRAAIAHQLVS
jgi:amidase